MESAQSVNNSATESATGLGSHTYIGDVNVIILERKRARNASLCEVDEFQTETASLLSKDNGKIKDRKFYDSIKDTLDKREVDGNTSINIEDGAPRKAKPACNRDVAKYTDTSDDGQYFGTRSMMSLEAAGEDIEMAYMDEQCDEKQALIPIEDDCSAIDGVNEKGINNETGNRFFSELYDNEVDIKRNFSDQEILDIRTAVHQQVNLLVENIGKIDPRLRIREVIPVGSAREGTQIVRPAEYDYILVLDDFSKPGAISLALPEDWKTASLEFVHVKLEDIELRSSFHEIIYKNDKIWASSSFPLQRKKGIRDMFDAAAARAVKRCANKSVKKNTGHLTCKSSKPEQHGPACTVTFEWHRKSSKPPMKISVDLCQALKLPWEVYEKMLRSNGCDVSNYLDKTHIENKVWSVLLMPHKSIYLLNAFKVTFTEAELLLTANLSDHHIKCYKLLKYITNPEIHPLQTFASRIKYFFQYESDGFDSYKLKIMVWNHQFHEKCYEENDTFACVFQMLCHFHDSSLRHPFNRNSRVKVTSDWNKNEISKSILDRTRDLGVLGSLEMIQKMSIDKYDYETCCHKLVIRDKIILKGFVAILIYIFVTAAILASCKTIKCIISLIVVFLIIFTFCTIGSIYNWRWRRFKYVISVFARQVILRFSLLFFPSRYY